MFQIKQQLPAAKNHPPPHLQDAHQYVKDVHET